ncbi:70_t:CDS:2 [Ambispora gerdemannii]|uniref:70_t:CDS:1 n=1 Tax=Ambispora gerdemannii TaxID=144530 RepID=A0A9N9G5B8_9GLOM|nr:70_t:CDS:2 [Ambispora gerdemannii]
MSPLKHCDDEPPSEGLHKAFGNDQQFTQKARTDRGSLTTLSKTRNYQSRRSGGYPKEPIRLVILGSDVCTNDSEAEELAEDLLAIVTVFVARHNELRSAANRRRRDTTQEIQEGSEETSSRQGTTHLPLSHPAGVAETQKMDENSTMSIQLMPYHG